MNLAEKIRLYRKRIHLTQEKLAELVGVSVMTIKRWEWNERIPRADEMSKLAAALGTTVGVLMGEVEPDAPEEKESAKNLPINNSVAENENASGKYLDLGYWGTVAENAKRAARSEDARKPLIAALLNSAMNEFSGQHTKTIAEKSIIGVNGNIQGDKNNVSVKP